MIESSSSYPDKTSHAFYSEKASFDIASLVFHSGSKASIFAIFLGCICTVWGFVTLPRAMYRVLRREISSGCWACNYACFFVC